MKKEDLTTVDKVWGEELWIVNSPLYCGKFLVVDKGAESSYHYHKTKTETFTCFEGFGILTVEGKKIRLMPFMRAVTIEPGEKHKFRAITELLLIETSTEHREDDVVRLTESKSGSDD